MSAPTEEEVRAGMRAVLDAMRASAPKTRSFVDAESEHGDGWCEWPIQSVVREGTCGRAGATMGTPGYGIRLCWQHEDSLFTEMLHRVRHAKAQDEVLDALMSRAEHVMDDVTEGGLRKHPQAWPSSIEDAIVRRLSDDYRLSPRIDEAIEDAITRRLAEKWGAA